MWVKHKNCTFQVVKKNWFCLPVGPGVGWSVGKETQTFKSH